MLEPQHQSGEISGGAASRCALDDPVNSSSPVLKNGRHHADHPLIGKRHVFCILAHVGLANLYAMRVNLSEAVQPMQKHFGWSDKQEGYVLSSFFWGYVVFQVPGAILADRFGGKRVFGIGVLGTSLLTLAVPLCSDQLWLLYLVRALTGFLEAVTYPALNQMFAHWVPTPERGRLTTLTNMGSYIGTALGMPIAGGLISLGQDSSGVSNTWPYVFYLFGAVGCLWFLFWEICAASTPAQHRTMGAAEREHLAATTFQDAEAAVHVERSARVPWASFLTHPACWTLFINHFAYNYSIYTMMTYMPKYLDEELGMDMKNAGLTSLLPYLLMVCIGIAGGRVADWLARHWRLRSVRIFLELVSFILSGGFLALLGFVTGNKILAVVVMTLAIGFSGLANASYNCNFMDIAPHYAGQLFGISNVFANLSGIIAPIVAGDILEDKVGAAAVEKWRLVFYVPGIVYTVAGVSWVFFMRTKPI